MKRSLLICLSVLLALAAIAATALAMESRSVQGMSLAAPAANGTARVAVAHLAPFGGTTAVTVELDGTAILTDFVYGDSTAYLPVATGTHSVAIYPGGSTTPAISETVDLEAKDYTAIAVGDGTNQALGLQLLEDNNTPPAAGKFRLRVGHLAPFASAITDTLADVRLQDGTLLLDDVPYGAVATMGELDAGTYDLKITSPDGSVTLIDPMPATFNAGDIVSVFATGDGTKQPLGVFALPRNVQGSFLDLAVSLQVAHLAPFALDPGTAVTVTIDSTAVLTDFAYGDSTGYVPLQAGVDHLIEIFPGGSGTAAISATVNLTHPMAFTAIAVGDGTNQPLDLKLLEDDNTPPAAGKFRVRVGHLAPFASVITDTWADVRLQDGTLLLDDVPYGAVATLPELDAGTYDLKITSPDGSVTLIDPMPATFNAGDIVSVFATGDVTKQPLGVFALPNNIQGFFLDLAVSLQVAHLAPFAMDPGTAVTVTIDSTAVLTDFAFADSTGYLPLEAGVDHLIEIFPGGSGTAAISATVNLTHPMAFTAIAVGDGSNQPLDLKLLEDDNTPPAAGKFRLRVGHLAPFASVITDTWADIRLQDGTPLLEDVPYGAVATLPELDAGTYDLKITAPGGTPTLIDPFLVTFNAGDILSAFAVGDGANQPLGVFALPSGQPGALLPLAKYQWLPIIFKNAAP